MLYVHLHGWPQQDVPALVSGHLGITRLPIVSHLDYYTATVEDIYLGHTGQVKIQIKAKHAYLISDDRITANLKNKSICI